MANDVEWQKHLDKQAEGAALDRQFQEYLEQRRGGGGPDVAGTSFALPHIDVKQNVLLKYYIAHKYLAPGQLEPVSLPSTALINMLFSPKMAKDLKANLVVVYEDIWLPENGPRWATVHWYMHIVAAFIGNAVTPVLAFLERVKKLVSVRT